jgi:hypothetical protein
MLFGIAENVMVICSEKRTRNLAWKSGISIMKMLLRMMRQEFLSSWAKNPFEMDHTPYPPDLSPSDFWSFKKKALKGERFSDIPDVNGVTNLLRGIPENNF